MYDKTMDKKFELERQLHEQYAINNNERMSSLITLFVSLFGVIGAYGYMFLHTTSQSASDLGSIYLENEKYTIDALLLTASICFIIIAIIQHLCIYQGAYQRKEQFIVYAIRVENYINDRLFPSTYNPFGKTRRNFVQGIYGELVKIFDFIKISIFVITNLSFYVFFKSNEIQCITDKYYDVCIISFLLSIFYIIIYKEKKYLDYFYLELQYSAKQVKNPYLLKCLTFIDCLIEKTPKKIKGIIKFMINIFRLIEPILQGVMVLLLFCAILFLFKTI